VSPVDESRSGEPAQQHSPPDSPPGDGRSRLLASLQSPGSRGQVVVAVLLAVLGFAAVVQVRATASDDQFTGARQADLIALITTLTLATDRASADIAELQQTRDSLRNESAATRTAMELARQRMETSSVLAGTVPVVGPGVRVKISGGGTAGIGTDQLLEGIQELRDAGAEAIEVNQRVRVVAQTGIEDSPQGLVVDGVTLRPPYVLDVVGDRDTLATAVQFQGGFADAVKEVGGTLNVTPLDEVAVESVRDQPALQYAQPVPEPAKSGNQSQ
jgi:uncharacterized protein YlxW (UPF0749 family)